MHETKSADITGPKPMSRMADIQSSYA